EYPFGMQGLKQNFPMRNRLVTGLSNGVLITEAARRSGTLHSVRHGLDQGKNIYAMPGSIFSKLSELPHYLIESGQAKFAACAEDILEDFIDLDLVERLSRSEEIDAFRFVADAKERNVVLELQHGRRTFDELLEVSQLSPAQLTSFLTRLEIEGALKETPGNTYMLIS
ncbi:MAG: DNA-protecting protein DprA, partial [Firmicutes bacterium]|nr:DNA-protecting protein DprA [Bacillota bacterium]